MVLKDIKEYTKLLKESYKQRVAAFEEPPTLAIIQVGDNEASNRYVKNKIKDCDEVGITAHCYKFEEDITEIELDQELRNLCDFYDGVIVQLPLPQHIRSSIATAAIPADKDVDGFRHDSWFNPATPQGIKSYLEYCGFDFVGKHIVIIGRSDIVDKPLARMLTDKDCTVTLCHSKTLWEDIWNSVNNSDLTICAVGQPHFLDCSSLSIPVIDVGINFDKEGKMCGDCFVWNGTERNVSPVPGGVGLLTRVALLENVVEAAYG
jgi:methylenetetrahydrofolate dehydrogenase (NADP+)/methenyltetrahydrofolate cyclohydrolase